MFRLTSCFGLAVMLAIVSSIGQVFAVTMPVPTHYYPFDTDFADHAGTNHGTPVGGAAIVTDVERGKVLDLDGINDYVNLLSSNMPVGATDTTVFTVAAWVRIAEGEFDNIHMGIYGEFAVGESKNFFYVGYPDERPSFDQYPPSGNAIISSQPVNDDTWHHVAYVQNEPGSFRRKIYVDGNLDVLDNSPETYVGPTPTSWAIGAYLGTAPVLPYYTEGRIDDLRFYDVALNADQVVTLAIPEPSTIILLAIGAGALLAYGWQRRRS